MYIHGPDFKGTFLYDNRPHSVLEYLSMTLTLILCKNSKEGSSQYHVSSNFIAFSIPAKIIVSYIILRNWFQRFSKIMYTVFTLRNSKFLYFVNINHTSVCISKPLKSKPISFS